MVIQVPKLSHFRIQFALKMSTFPAGIAACTYLKPPFEHKKAPEVRQSARIAGQRAVDHAALHGCMAGLWHGETVAVGGGGIVAVAGLWQRRLKRAK